MNLGSYNNFGIVSIALHSTIYELGELSLAKAMLIMPFYAHKPLTDYLARKNVQILSIEYLIALKIECFSNFNDRYEDTSVETIHAIQYLIETKIISFRNGILICNVPFKYDSKMGKRAKKISKASKNMAKIMNEDSSKLYLNLRVDL